jgi:predicted RNA-binding Zn ribbon-like protein
LPKRRAEHLGSYADLVAFAMQSRLIPPKLAASLRARASRDPAEGQRAFRQSIVLREVLYRAFSAIAAGKYARPEDVQQINDFALEAVKHRKLARTNGSYCWEWQSDGNAPLDRILWPIAESAADFLTSKDRAAVRECGAPDCEWLFLDHSRNGSRRWCDMKSCGNRQKARRHYQRAHG